MYLGYFRLYWVADALLRHVIVDDGRYLRVTAYNVHLRKNYGIKVTSTNTKCFEVTF